MASYSDASSDSDAVVIDRDDVSNYNPEQILPESAETISKIRAWLQPTSYDLENGEYRKHLGSHEPGTGDWLTATDAYRGWRDGNQHGLLWLRGIPGSGKSVQAAKITDQLKRDYPGTPVLYFFFRQIIDANHKPVALLRDWLDQVLLYSPPLQRHLKDYVEGQRKLESLSMEDLWKDLKLAFSGLPGRVYCVADALDEMDRGNDAFLSALAELGQWRPGSVKLVITSRPVSSIETTLRNFKACHIRLEEVLVDVDIATFVHHSLERSSIGPADREVIREAIPGRANGLFLFAKLAMEAFLQPGARADEVLQRLPADLDHMYTDLLKEHAQRTGVPEAIQLLILEWVTHATRPLRLLELAEVIRVVHPVGDQPRDLKATKDLVRVACGSLLEVLPDETVSVVHHSFTEFLQGLTRTAESHGYPILAPGLTHSRLAVACLTYLQAGCLDHVMRTNQHQAPESESDSDSDRDYSTEDPTMFSTAPVKIKLKYPFLEYAATCWHIHAGRSADAGENAELVNPSIRSLLDDPERTKAWLSLVWPGQQRAAKGVTNLHIAAKTGLRAYAETLLSSGTAEVDRLDKAGRTPLWWAAERGHADIIRLLVRAGANPDRENRLQGLKPLHVAARNDRYEAVTALLEAGVNPLTEKTKEDPGIGCGNAPTSVGHTPLMYACENGHWKSVQAFLPFLKDHGMVHRALLWSVQCRQHHIVEKLLQQASGLDVNAKYRGDTALFIACSPADPKSIKMLLQAGADPTVFCNNSGDEFGGINSYTSYDPDDEYSDTHPTRGLTALHMFCKSPYSGYYHRSLEPEKTHSAFELLVQHGANIHQRTRSGRTPLHVAAWDPVLTRILIDAGAEVNAEDDDGVTPLHLAESPDVIAVLLENGANIDSCSKHDGRTPLFSKFAKSEAQAMLRFLEYGPDCSVVDNAGNGILHVAAQQSCDNVEVFTALLRAGADPNLTNQDGDTPLHCLVQRARHNNIGPLLDTMINAGADIDVKNKEGSTLLFLAIRNGSYPFKSHEDLRRLLNRGASTDIRDYGGRTVLHEAVLRHNHRLSFGGGAVANSRLDFFLGLGLDPFVVDFSGNNLLHELALGVNDTSYINLWRQLIALGLDPNAVNNHGQTPLHILVGEFGCSTYHPDEYLPIDLLIDKMKTVDVPDKDGITPLHIAATLLPLGVKKLLEAGADPLKPTFDRLTPLHLAARARQSNIVGMILDKLRGIEQGHGHQSPWVKATKWDKPAAGVDTQPLSGLTPLFYACRSGRPETVSLLLQAGADVSATSRHKMTVFHACADFEIEQALWESDQLDVNGHERYAGLKRADKSRPMIEPKGLSNWREMLRRNIDTTRLEEILEMLVNHGARMADGEARVPVDTGTVGFLQGRANYAIECLERFNKGRSADDEHLLTTEENIICANRFVEHALPYYRDIKAKALREFDGLEQGTRNEQIFHTLMLQREYDLVASLPSLGTDFVGRDLNGVNNIGILIQHGFASLLSRVGAVEAERNFAAGRWHAAGAPDRPGLGVCVQDPEAEQPRRYVVEPLPFLLQAVKRDLPNIDVVRVLVDELGVDVNEFETSHQWVSSSKYIPVPTMSALHHAALGVHWWHYSQAIPFLASRGADLNLRNYKGQTPLHFALGGSDSHYPGPFREEAARALIAAGADINAVDEGGVTCLGCAVKNVRMVRLLLENGATAAGRALAEAANQQNIDVLQCLLEAGADPNARPEPLVDDTDKEPPIRLPDVVSGPLLGDVGILDDPGEECVLYIAATRYRDFRHTYGLNDSKSKDRVRDLARRMVEALLEHGADPLGKLVVPDDTGIRGGVPSTRHEEEESDFRDPTAASDAVQRIESTILHEIILTGGLVQPFFALPNLDPNRRDSRGRTLLHAVCYSNRGPDVLVDGSSPEDKNTENKKDAAPSSMSYLNHLLALGADPLAVDNNGNNVLHAMLGPLNYHSSRPYLASLRQLAAAHPSLLVQRNAQGRTPLLLAARLASADGDASGVSALLTFGCDITAADKYGDTILHALAPRLSDSADIFALFKDCLARGADISARNATGETPLFGYFGDANTPRRKVWPHDDEAATVQEVMRVFDDTGADYTVTDNKGRGLLHAAVSRGKIGGAMRFAILLERGLDPLSLDREERSAVDIAAMCGNSGVLALFERGAGGGWDRDKVRKLLSGGDKSADIP